jgi:carboxylesterase type B
MELSRLVRFYQRASRSFTDRKADPAVDGEFVPALPGKLLLQGGFDKSLNIMAGHNINEGIEFMDAFAQTEARIEADFRIYFPTITDAAIQYITQTLYPPVFNGTFGYTTETERGALWVTEAFFTCSTNYLARAYGEKTHNYIFSVPPSLHGDDIWYTYYDGPSPLVQNDTLAVIMQDYFTNFAITGNPNGPGLPNFPTYGSGSTVQNLGLATIGPIQDNAANQRCLWWQKGLFA